MATEIFTNISQEIKDQVKAVADFALSLSDVKQAAGVMNAYTNTTLNSEEKEFIEFYFNLRMEQMLMQ